MKFMVSVPATSANIGPGYDVWGLALDIRNEFHCEVADVNREIQYEPVDLSYEGLARATPADSQPDSIPYDEDNLIYHSFNEVFSRTNITPPNVKISCHLQIPFAHGLGSSSTAILAGLVIANEILRHVHKQAFSYDDLLRIAIDLEGHPDNVAPAMLGGLVLAFRTRNENQPYVWQRLPLAAPLQLAGLIPHQPLSTKVARQVVPTTVDTAEVAFHVARATLLGYLFAKESWLPEDFGKFNNALDDNLHQKQRSHFIVGMNETFRHWYSLGSHGSYLSGAGTTLLSFWDDSIDCRQLNLGGAMDELGVDYSAFFPRIDRRGLFIEKI